MRTFGDALDALRIDILRDDKADRLWRDEALVDCIMQAHVEFAERTLCLRDTTSEITRVALTAGEDLYPLDASILTVMSARIAGDTFDLTRVSHPQLAGEPPVSDAIAWLDQVNSQSHTGRPVAYSTDEGVDGTGAAPVLRVFGIPTAAEEGLEVVMRVARLPRVLASMDTLDSEIEMPVQYRRGLLYGAAAYAYDTHDADAGDGAEATRMRGKFDSVIELAKAATITKMHQPLKWGFGRGGFNHK